MQPFDYPFIRDELVIDQTVQDFYDGFTGDGGFVYLLGRRVSHAQNLRVGARPLVVIADVYDGTGGMIDASGTIGGGGGNGANGASPGASGEMGGSGGAGGNGGTVMVYARSSVNAHVSVSGGYGGHGGDGGNGADGTPDDVTSGYWTDPNNTPDDPSDDVWVDPQTIPGIVGGSGGRGGNGGAGGNGGFIRFFSISDDTAPVLEAAGGAGNGGGWGGTGGMYSPAQDDGTDIAPSGDDGAWGADGTVTYFNFDEHDLVQSILSQLGGYLGYWAPFRVAVGDWYYHRHIDDPTVPDDGFAALAATEFERALEMQPDNADALRLQAQLASGVNALGLDPELDVLPVFDEYVQAFAAFSAIALNFVSSGTGQLAAALTLQDLAGFADLMGQQAAAARDAATDQLGIATTEHQFANDEIAYAQQRVDQASADITAEMAAMEQARLDSSGISFGTVAEVAGAVVGIIAAVPSGGASLVTLVPAIATLASTVLTDAAPIATAVLSGSDADLADITAAYKKIGKDAPKEVGEGVKAIVNFVSVVQKLTAATTTDNSKYVALVRRGVECAHELLLAQRRTAMAQQRVDAAQHDIDRAQAIVASAAALSAQAHAQSATLHDAGLVTVDTARAAASSLLGFAFRAQRAVEICTLRPEASHVHLDTGMLAPDYLRAYDEGRHSDAEHVAAVAAAWNPLMKPVALEADYLSYFDTPPDTDQLRLSFAPDSPEVASLRATGVLAFRVDVGDIPAGRYDAKTVGARVALVGATHPNGQISTQLRHGAEHQQRRPDGSVAVQLLAPRTATRQTILSALSGDPDADLDAPLTDPTTYRLWGRGLAGAWELSIPADQQQGLDLGPLTSVQVWIAYRFLGG